jgi:hypothetical protein
MSSQVIQQPISTVRFTFSLASLIANLDTCALFYEKYEKLIFFNDVLKKG